MNQTNPHKHAAITETVSYRVGVFKEEDGSHYFLTSHGQLKESTVEELDEFVRWAGERQTVEV